MTTKINYDEEADVLYISFGRSDNVHYVNLTDNIILRLDTGLENDRLPRAIGLTFVSYQAMRLSLAGQPIIVPLTNLRNLPDELWQAVVSVISSAPVTDILDVAFSLAVQIPELPAPAAI